MIGVMAMLAGSMALHAQEVRSEKSGFRLSNLPPEPVPDTVPPFINYISPGLSPGVVFSSDLPEIDLIGRVTDTSGISFFSVNAEFKELTETGIFTSALKLEEGMNRFRVVAMDLEENILEHFLLINYTPPVVTLADKITRESNYYGLIIGIDRYRDPGIPELENAVKDAGDLYQVLTGLYSFREENIRFLKNATRSDIIQSLDELGQMVTPSDNLLIFYAGHGWWDGVANNGYWLPSDAESNVKTNWFRNSTLVDYLKEINSKHTLLIADACFGGSIFKTRSAFGNREKAYEKLYELPSRKAMTSGTLTEVPDRSAFTRFLLQRLKENEEKYLASEQLFSSFRFAVINNSDVIPQYGEIKDVGDQGGDFIFLKKE